MGGCKVKMENVGLADNSECWPEVSRRSHDFYFGSLVTERPKICPVEARCLKHWIIIIRELGVMEVAVSYQGLLKVSIDHWLRSS